MQYCTLSHIKAAVSGAVSLCLEASKGGDRNPGFNAKVMVCL